VTSTGGVSEKDPGGTKRFGRRRSVTQKEGDEEETFHELLGRIHTKGIEQIEKRVSRLEVKKKGLGGYYTHRGNVKVVEQLRDQKWMTREIEREGREKHTKRGNREKGTKWGDLRQRGRGKSRL